MIMQGMPPIDLKKIESQLNAQKLYNLQLVKQNHLMKNEAKVTKETLAEVERRMKNYYVLHFDHWMNLFSDFK